LACKIHDTTLYDAAVIGSGFGGLATALTLAERGKKVVLFERLNYPGGCASTFTRKGHKFESGATLFSGFGPGQLFHSWMQRHDMDVEFEAIDPLVELRAPGFTLHATRKRHELLRQMLRLPKAPTRGLVRFFDEQKRVADMLWELFDDPSLLPPFGIQELARHASRLPRYASLLPLVGRPLSSAVKRWGAGGFEPLRIYLDAICQITVQASSRQAEAPFAIGAMDYYYRGTGHIHGGIGELAWAMTRAIERSGGVVHMTDQVRGVERRPHGWSVTSRRRTIQARNVVANLLPQDLSKMLTDDEPRPRRLGRLTKRLEDSWGAVMLYLALDAGSLEREEAHHVELVVDPSKPFIEGNHLFCSISGANEPERAPEGRRTVTVSTHVPMRKLKAMSNEERGEFIAGIQDTMREGLAARAPELLEHCVMEMTASPRTFERFTGRALGYVGGIPRMHGLSNYEGVFPWPISPNLYLVGDHVFPGQSTLAVALGGIKAAEMVIDSSG